MNDHHSPFVNERPALTLGTAPDNKKQHADGKARPMCFFDSSNSSGGEVGKWGNGELGRRGSDIFQCGSDISHFLSKVFIFSKPFQIF